MIEHDYVDLDGVRLHVARQGDGDLVLFAHGFPEFWYAWKNQLEEFGRDHLAIAPDMRGYNLSSKPDKVEDYAVANIVGDIAGLARHFGQERFILVAHDWGGVAAWAFAMTHPEMLKRLVIVNAPHPGTFLREVATNPAQIEASQYMRFFRTPDAEAVLSQNGFSILWERVFAEAEKNGVMNQDDKAAYIEAWSQPGALTGGLNWYRASSFDIPEAGKGTVAVPAFDKDSFKVTVPTLVIWGEKDTALLPSLLEGLEEYVPDLTVRRIPDGSHWVIHERPNQVNGYIREFIADA